MANDDRSRSDAQMLVCFRDARARQLAGGLPIDERIVARVQAIVDDFAREATALGRLSEAGIEFDSCSLPPSTRVAHV